MNALILAVALTGQCDVQAYALEIPALTASMPCAPSPYRVALPGQPLRRVGRAVKALDDALFPRKPVRTFFKEREPLRRLWRRGLPGQPLRRVGRLLGRR